MITDATIARIRRTDRLPVNPYTFDAGKGPGIDTVSSIVALAQLADCGLDPGASGHPIILFNLPKDDADLRALLVLAQLEEQPEDRHARYVEAAERGVDIGPDRDFLAALRYDEHLADDFLRGSDSY